MWSACPNRNAPGMLGVTAVPPPPPPFAQLLRPSLLWFPGPDSRQVASLSLLTSWVVFWERLPWCSGDVLGLFAEEHDSEENEKRRKKKKGTKRKRDGRDQEERTLSCDLKLDDMLDRTLEDGAKQHNLTAVNVRNILHVSMTRAVV